MDVQEIKKGFLLDLENGLDHAEWYEKELSWLIETVEEQQRQLEQSGRK